MGIPVDGNKTQVIQKLDVRKAYEMLKDELR